MRRPNYLRAGQGWHHVNRSPGAPRTNALTTPQYKQAGVRWRRKSVGTLLTLRQKWWRPAQFSLPDALPTATLRLCYPCSFGAMAKRIARKVVVLEGRLCLIEKLQYGLWEKIRQCNLIIFRQLRAAGYGWFYGLEAFRAVCQMGAFQPCASLMDSETKSSQDVLSMCKGT